MAQLHSTWFYITPPWLYFTVLYYILLHHGSISFYTLLYDGSTSLYLILHYPTMALYFTVLNSTLLYHGSKSLYLILHYSTMALLHFTSLYLIYSIMALLHSTWLYDTWSWLYFTLFCSTLLHYDSTSFYFTLLYCTKTAEVGYSQVWAQSWVMLAYVLLDRTGNVFHIKNFSNVESVETSSNTSQVSKWNILATSKLSYILVIHLLGEPTTDVACWMLTCHRTLSSGASLLVSFVWRVQNEVPLPCCTRVSHKGVNSTPHGWIQS